MNYVPPKVYVEAVNPSIIEYDFLEAESLKK